MCLQAYTPPGSSNSYLHDQHLRWYSMVPDIQQVMVAEDITTICPASPECVYDNIYCVEDS